MIKVIGVDEAGKGAVIGSLFVGFAIGCLEDEGGLEEFQSSLRSLGVKDSKQLVSEKREEIFISLEGCLTIKYAQITPFQIDENNSQGRTLFELEVRAIAEVVNRENPKILFVDSLSSNPKKFAGYLRKFLTVNCEIIAENKADVKYPIVSSASVIAKVLRERELDEIKKNIKINCGSGYPSDWRTVEFLRKYFKSEDFAFIFRKSWQSYKDLTLKTIKDY